MNDGKRDTEHLYVWLARDPTGVEGVIAVPTDMGVMPLMSTDKEIAATFKDPATHAAMARGQGQAYLVQFNKGPVLDYTENNFPAGMPVFSDFAPEAFPFTISMWSKDADRDGPPTHEYHVQGPGVLEIPPIGSGSKVKITYATGRIWEFDGAETGPYQ